jgi:hypothetical protein
MLEQAWQGIGVLVGRDHRTYRRKQQMAHFGKNLSSKLSLAKEGSAFAGASVFDMAVAF